MSDVIDRDDNSGDDAGTTFERSDCGHHFGGPSVTRRGFLQTAAAAAGVATVAPVRAQSAATASNSTAASAAVRPVTLNVNGRNITLQIEPNVTLLDALREYVGLTGTKKGCDRGQCGACTVLLDGRRVNSCLTLAVMSEGRQITTVEGLASSEHLAPIQAAFVEYDAFQCGFCTPGQLCSATAVMKDLREGRVSAVTPDVRAARVAIDDAELRERMSGNICRCGAYPNIVRAIKSVIAQTDSAVAKPPPINTAVVASATSRS
jgi:xanthine dehydrogenase YagT iron-sulfur-binding subunit